MSANYPTPSHRGGGWAHDPNAGVHPQPQHQHHHQPSPWAPPQDAQQAPMYGQQTSMYGQQPDMGSQDAHNMFSQQHHLQQQQYYQPPAHDQQPQPGQIHHNQASTQHQPTPIAAAQQQQFYPPQPHGQHPLPVHAPYQPLEQLSYHLHPTAATTAQQHYDQISSRSAPRDIAHKRAPAPTTTATATRKHRKGATAGAAKGSGSAAPSGSGSVPSTSSGAAVEGAQDGAGEGNEEGGAEGKTPGTGTTSDFVKKLYKMLEDPLYAHVVSWNSTGESFIDMNDFTKLALPRHFKHSNFASFVRQLNKYDFHKVKSGEEGASQYGEHSWEFKHPDFQCDKKELLENIKRKVPSQKKAKLLDAGSDGAQEGPSVPLSTPSAELAQAATAYNELKSQVESLTRIQDTMNTHISTLTKNYQGVIGEMLTFQRNMIAQDQLMQNLIQYLVNLEADRKADTSIAAGGSVSSIESTPFVPSDEAQKLITSYTDVARASFAQMNEIARRASLSNFIGPSQPNHHSSHPQLPSLDHQSHDQHLSDFHAPFDDSYQPHTTYQSAPHSAASAEFPKSPQSADSAMSAADTPHDLASQHQSQGQQQRPHGLPPHQHQQHSSSSIRAEGPPKVPSSETDGDKLPAFYIHPPHSNLSDNTQDMVDPLGSAGEDPNAVNAAGKGGLRVFTVGTLMPKRESEDPSSPQRASPGAGAKGMSTGGRRASATPGGDDQPFGIMVPHLDELPSGMPRLDATTPQASPSGAGATAGASPLHPQQSKDGTRTTPDETEEGYDSGTKTLRVRRSTYVPGWAVPPKVLLVEDDAVCRKLSSKFLQVFGCEIDVAVDGVSAVNKMNLEKYDLVLMDIVMPNLDGVSATSLIRQFDPMTPIISMTSNSNPNEILTYFSHGMNDVLPKPFTKETLLNMLEKHLIHLKTMKQMAEIPKALGLPPLSEDVLQEALTTAVASSHANGGKPPTPLAAGLHSGSAESGKEATPQGEEVVNPLAGMGFSDDEYVTMLQSLIAAGAVSDANGNFSNPASAAVSASLGSMGSGSSSGGGNVGNGGAPGPSSLKRHPSSGISSGVETERAEGRKRNRFEEMA